MSFIRVQWDRVAAGLAILIGLLALLLGYLGTSGTEYIAKQIPYIISGGLVGIFFLGVGTALWLSADLRDEWREMRNLGSTIRQEQIDRRAELRALSEQRPVDAVSSSPRGRSGSRAVAASSNGAGGAPQARAKRP